MYMSFMLPEAFEFIERHFDSLEKFTRGDPNIWDIIYDKVPRLLELWDPCKCDDQDKYVFGQLYLYRLKYWMRSSRDQTVSLDVIDTTIIEGTFPGVESSIEVSILLKKLPKKDADLLWWRFACDFTLTELSEHYGVCRSVVKRKIEEALSRAISVLNRPRPQ